MPVIKVPKVLPTLRHKGPLPVRPLRTRHFERNGILTSIAWGWKRGTLVRRTTTTLADGTVLIGGWVTSQARSMSYAEAKRFVVCTLNKAHEVYE